MYDSELTYTEQDDCSRRLQDGAIFNKDFSYLYENISEGTQGMQLKGLEDINLYDLMAEDHRAYLYKTASGDFNLEIDDEDSKTILEEVKLHKYALESLANFCKSFLHYYSIHSELKD